MKFSFLSLFFAIAVVFSFGIEASAHDYERSDKQHIYKHSQDVNILAKDVNVASEDDVKKFVRHIAKHIDLIANDNNIDRLKEITIFYKETRRAGPLNDGDIYFISVTPRAAIANHGKHPGLYSHRYKVSTDPLKTLLGDDVPEEFSDTVDPVCAEYSYDGKQRIACAIGQDTPNGFRIAIAGFHHAEKNDALITPPDCKNFTLDVTAEDVENETDPEKKKDLLKQYVDGFASVFGKEMETIQLQLFAEDRTLATDLRRFGVELNARMIETAACSRSKDFYHGSVYPFIMDPKSGTSYLNGLDFDLIGLSAALTDPDPIQCDGDNILTAFQNAITNGSGNVPADLAIGNNGFVKYHWDNPTVDGDEVEDYLERGVVPGRSVKESYIKVVNATPKLFTDRGAPPFLVIFGSGIYLDEADKENCESADDDDGGCAIAGTGGTLQSALLNLFLIASVLLPAVFLKKRA